MVQRRGFVSFAAVASSGAFDAECETAGRGAVDLQIVHLRIG